MKLKHQMLLICLTAGTFLLCLFGLLLIGQVFSYQLRQECISLEQQSITVSQNLEATAVNYALQSISMSDELLHDLFIDLSVRTPENIGLYAPDGVPFFGNLPIPMPQEGIHSTDGKLSVLRSVHLNGNSYFLWMSHDLTALYELRRSLIYGYMVLYLIGMSIFTLSMYWIAGRFARPIEQLAAVSHRLSCGEMKERATASHCIEIYTLATAFNDMADSLTGQIERQQRFIADLTHEMKTPLTAMMGHADLIRSQRVTGEDALMASHQIFKEGQRLNALCTRLIDLILLGKEELYSGELFAPHLIEETVSALLPEAQRRGIGLSGTADEALILGDNALIRVLLSNLVDNALKSEAQNVSIEGRFENDTFLLTVRDDGRGMDEESLSRITEPFYRVDKSRSRAQGGAGLGLTLCQEIARLHHTELKFDSIPSVGTTVSVRFAGKEAGIDA